MTATGSQTDLPRPAARRGGLTVWFTGLSSAGKSSISRELLTKLRACGWRVERLDGDEMRQSLSKGLGFDKEGRDENIRRIGQVAQTLTRQGAVVLVAAVSPYRAAREEVRQRIGRFLEVYVNAPLAVCEQRDTTGIYRRARCGEIRHVAGLDDPYEPPLSPDVECRTDLETLEASASRVFEAVECWFASRPDLDSAGT
jgi:adenylylsulfate kinase